MTADRATESDAAEPNERPDAAPTGTKDDGGATRTASEPTATVAEEPTGPISASAPSAPPAATAPADTAATEVGATEAAEAAAAQAEPEPPPASAPPPAPVEDPRIAELTKELDTLRAQRSELTEKLLRTAADFDNYRKRSRRELDEAKLRGRDETIRELLPVFDNLERAVAASSASLESSAVLEGVRMVLKLFEDTAQRMGLVRVPSVGARFDPAVHEALQQRETDEAPPGTVITEVTPGYAFGKRLLRAALVIVAREPTPPKISPASETIRAVPFPESAPEPDRPADAPSEAPAAAPDAAAVPQASTAADAPAAPPDATTDTPRQPADDTASVDDSTSDAEREDDAAATRKGESP